MWELETMWSRISLNTTRLMRGYTKKLYTKLKTKVAYLRSENLMKTSVIFDLLLVVNYLKKTWLNGHVNAVSQ